MEILKPEADIDLFFHVLKNEKKSLLILDYDGTLAPFKQDPDKAIPYPGVCERIEKIMRLDRSKVVIVSGRSLESLGKLLPITPLPELWGSHGGERLIQGSGKVKWMENVLGASEAVREAAAISAATAPVLFCEIKPFSAALHLRGKQTDEERGLANRVRKKWTALALKYGMELHDFDGGIELRPQGVNKGKAVTLLLKELPQTTSIAYMGDDLTDEAAFEAMGRRGMKVLVRKEARPTLADIRLTPPEELLHFLDRWISCLKEMVR